MTHLMARDKLEEQLPRLLAGIVGLYKRHPEPFHVTQVFPKNILAVLSKAASKKSTDADQIMSLEAS